MINYIFRRAIFLSFLGHLALFSFFSFSFGLKIPRNACGEVSFLGSFLRNSDLCLVFKKQEENQPSTIKAHLLLDKTSRKHSFLELQDFLKPAANLTLVGDEKITFLPKLAVSKPPLARKESTIIFHPQLPYDFLLYFKDRQRVHLELAFQIVSQDKAGAILVKRKISSGNLEADLLSLRYISRYLSIQKLRFEPNTWQTVKIDLSP